jgi:hypothetical protein
MHEYQSADKKTLRQSLIKSYPFKLKIDNVQDLKKFYWLFSDLAFEHLNKMREKIYNYAQSQSGIDYDIMKRSEADYAAQLESLKSFSVFYACHHYLGTEGFESVSVD